MTLPVVYEGARLRAVDKPSGLGSEDAAAACAMKLVHRIDKGTSGLLLLASDARTVQRMQRLLASGAVERTYALVAHGRLASGEIESRLVRDRGDGLRGSSSDGSGKLARTRVEVRGYDPNLGTTTALATLVTGRTHQIRIHLAEAGHPLVGETVYDRDRRAAGRPVVRADRLMLHAWRLSFVHPNTRDALRIECPLPAGFSGDADGALHGASR